MSNYFLSSNRFFQLFNWVLFLFFFLLDCKSLFHTKCIQNGGVIKLPCSQQSYSGITSVRRKQRKHVGTLAEKSNVVSNVSPTVIVSSNTNAVRDQPHSKFSLTGTSEFIDSHDKIISDARELQLMQDFINKKVNNNEGYNISLAEVRHLLFVNLSYNNPSLSNTSIHSQRG